MRVSIRQFMHRLDLLTQCPREWKLSLSTAVWGGKGGISQPDPQRRFPASSACIRTLAYFDSPLQNFTSKSGSSATSLPVYLRLSTHPFKKNKKAEEK
ncbi:hypothetical protein CRENBAI_012064, partial [Crenichthys baileyi]